MILTGYIEELFSQTAYSINVYVKPGANAIRLTRLTRVDIESRKGPQIRCTFRVKAKTKSQSKAKGKGKKAAADSEEDESDVDGPIDKFIAPSKRKRTTNQDESFTGLLAAADNLYEDDSDDIESEEPWQVWQYSIGNPPPAKKKARASTSTQYVDPDDVITLSSD